MVNGWEKRSLLSCVDLLQGLTYSPDNVQPYGLLVLRSSNIKGGKLILNDCVYVDCTVDRNKYVKPNDILICVRNGSSALIGKSCVIDQAYNATFGAFMSVLRGDVTGYIAHVFSSDIVQAQIRNRSSATINQITKRDFEDIIIPMPDETMEQHAIATALSGADAYIAALEKLIAKKCNIKQGAMQELLTGNRRLPGFSGEWVEKPLGTLLKYEQPQKYIVLDTKYLTSGTPVLTAGKTLVLGYTAETDGVYDNTPVIIFDDFTTESKLIDFKFKVKSSAMKMLSPTGLCDIRIIFELMQMVDFTLKDHQRYWISEYSKICVSIPNTQAEQSAIAAVLSDMDAEIDGLTAKLRKAKQIKQGMMNELLTGRIRLL